MSTQSRNSASRLRLRLFLYLAFALLCLATLLFVATYSLLINHLKAAEDKGLAYNIEARSMALGQWSQRAKDIARQVTSRTRIRQELEKYNERQISLDTLEKFTSPKLADAMNRTEEIVGIIRLDKSKQVVARCGEVEDVLKSADFIEELRSTPGTFLSHPIHCKSGPVIIAAAPILSPDGVAQGKDLVLLKSATLHSLLDPVNDQDIIEDAVVAYREKGIFKPVCLLDQRHAMFCKNPEMEPFFEKAMEGDSGIDYASELSVAYQGVPHSTWALLGTVSKDRLYAAVNRKILILATIFSIAYFAILLGFWILMKPLAGALLMQVSELEEEVRERTAEKQEAIDELQTALENIKTLQGLLPICAYCKKIRDDQGYWNQIEVYVKDHSGADFSHGICPECMEKHHPKYASKKQES